MQDDRRDDHHADQEQPVRADIEAQHAHLPAQEIGQAHRLLRRAEEVRRRRDGHEHEADREHHLVQVRGLVQPLVERALQHDAGRRRHREGDRQRR